MSRRSVSRALRLAAALALSAVPVRAQHAPDPELEAAESAMLACATAAAERRHPDALAQAKVAEGAFRARIAIRPNDVRALVGLARTLGSCRIPSADLALMGELSAESVELLQRALDVAPDHWLARYILALNYYRAPPFLGRAKDAARELDRLIAQQGERAAPPELARPFEYRGLLWARAGQRDSALAVWRRGLRLFPSDSALRARLGAAGDGAPAAPLVPTTDSSPAATPRGAVPSSSAPVPARVAAVRVVASHGAADAQAAPSVRQLTRSDVVTTAGGMADVMLAVQLQPGATRVGESAELFTRGGDPTETPVLVDGGRILSVARFEGLNGSTFGALDPWVVRTARFSTGGFSVQRGNALSGVLEIETDGRPRAAQWRAGLGIAQAGATARVPLGTRSGAWGTLRGTHAGALLGTHGRSGEFARAPYSVEAMGAFVAQPRPGTEYRVVGLAVHDASARIVDANGYRGAFASEGATHALVLSSQHLGATLPLIVRANVALSQRAVDWRFGALARDRTERSGIARAAMEYAPRPEVILRGGVEGSRLSRTEAGALPASPAVAPGSPTRPLATDSGASHAGAFAEAELHAGRYRAVAGVRADRLPGEQDVTADPRLALSARVGSWTTRIAAGQFHQGRWRAESSIPDAGTPSGLPRRARHLVVGLERDGTASIRAEAFVKRYGEYGEWGAGPPVRGGTARGVDLVVQRQAGGRLRGWLGWSLLDAELQLADGRTARSPYDVTHTATGSATLRMGRGTVLGSTMRYGTGRPFTPIAGARTDSGSRPLPAYGAPTSERLPAYARLDTRLTRYLPLRRALLVSFVEVLNLLDRENVAGFVWDDDYRTRRATPTFYASRTVMVGFELQSR